MYAENNIGHSFASFGWERQQNSAAVVVAVSAGAQYRCSVLAAAVSDSFAIHANFPCDGAPEDVLSACVETIT